jgi:RNA polymerase sigma factor (sigma-70 family)
MNTSSAKEQKEAATEDDLSLILRMADKEGHPQDAEDALAVFFCRHHPLLKGFAEQNNFRSLGFDPEDFVLQTFQKAYDRIGTFDAPAGISPDQLRKKVQSWLFEIAKNEFLMELRKGLNQSEETRDPALMAPSLEEEAADEAPELTGRAAAVRTFLDGLPEGDRQLLETSMNFYDFKLKKASSGIFWEFFIGRDRGPIRRSGKRCRS